MLCQLSYTGLTGPGEPDAESLPGYRLTADIGNGLHRALQVWMPSISAPDRLPGSRARPGRYAAAGARFLDCSRNRVPSLSPSPSCLSAQRAVTAPAVRLPRDQASSAAACTHPPPVTAKSLLLNSSWVRKWRPLITWLYSCPAVPWVAP